jgi:hypothetical protein
MIGTAMPTTSRRATFLEVDLSKALPTTSHTPCADEEYCLQQAFCLSFVSHKAPEASRKTYAWVHK